MSNKTCVLGWAVLVVAMLCQPSAAHESWISSGGFRSPVSNEWCCGASDCEAIPAERVHANGVGYELMIGRVEIVPYREALPSIDGQYWRCHRADGSRRCFFAPEPSA
jgi:hypothetical protein